MKERKPVVPKDLTFEEFKEQIFNSAESVFSGSLPQEDQKAERTCLHCHKLIGPDEKFYRTNNIGWDDPEYIHKDCLDKRAQQLIDSRKWTCPDFCNATLPLSPASAGLGRYVAADAEFSREGFS